MALGEAEVVTDGRGLLRRFDDVPGPRGAESQRIEHELEVGESHGAVGKAQIVCPALRVGKDDAGGVAQNDVPAPVKGRALVLETLHAAHGVDGDGSELAYKFGISSIPTVMFFKDGSEYTREIGYMPKEHYTAILEDMQ